MSIKCDLYQPALLMCSSEEGETERETLMARGPQPLQSGSGKKIDSLSFVNDLLRQ